jgi:hypothetical protein
MFQLNNCTKENTFLRFNGSVLNICVVEAYAVLQLKGKFFEFSLQQCSSQPSGEHIVAGGINSSEIVLGCKVRRGDTKISRTATKLRYALSCLKTKYIGIKVFQATRTFR